jgi:hypothetical protein
VGIQSTTELTRADAEERYIEMRKEAMKNGLRAEATGMTDEQLEDALESKFDNYTITAEPVVRGPT